MNKKKKNPNPCRSNPYKYTICCFTTEPWHCLPLATGTSFMAISNLLYSLRMDHSYCLASHFSILDDKDVLPADGTDRRGYCSENLAGPREL